MRFLRYKIALGGFVATAGLTVILRQVFASVEPAALWANVPVLEPQGFWSWLAKENKRLQGERRRASWTALKSQGAKGSLRDNLRDDRRYLTASTYDGFTNQFMMIANTIYISRHANRIPILPTFLAHPVHLRGSDEDIAVSEVFDLNRLALSLGGLPIVEVHELMQFENEPERLKVVKYDGEFEQVDDQGRRLAVRDMIPAEPARGDDIGCWSWFQRHGMTGGGHVWRLPGAHWTPIPHSLFDNESALDAGADIFKLISFVDQTTEVPEESLRILDEQGITRPKILPDISLVCLDSVYWYLGQKRRWSLHAEWREGEGVWANVGKHMQFQPGLVRLADDYLRHSFGLSRTDPLPPFFAVHIRRGDFVQEWLELSADHFAHAAWEAIQEIKQNIGVHIKHVVFTTDEQDPIWRAPLVSYGWHFVDHAAAGTSEKFGLWLPTILDAIILSRAFGFLGSSGSTMSIVAMRRVIDWNGGFGRLLGLYHQLPEDWSWT